MLWKKPIRPVAVVLLTTYLSACSLHLSQDENKVLLGKGEGVREEHAAKDYAAYYLPYALLSDMAYQSLRDQAKRPECGVPGKMPCTGLDVGEESNKATREHFVSAIQADTYPLAVSEDGSSPPAIDTMARAKKILDPWTLLGAYQISDATPIEEICDARKNPTSSWCHPFRGLEVQAWGMYEPNGRKQLVIAFRGSDPEEGDWVTNLRWITRFIPAGYDQYDQVRDNIDTWIKQAVEAYGKKFPDSKVGTCADIPPENCPIEMIATGHSLGGGLAQQAAYASNGRIRRSITFDPSPVTGYYSVSEADRGVAARDLIIDRVYEHGEVLAFIRLFMREIYSVSSSNPTIYQARFDKIGGSIFSQHNRKALIGSYMTLVGTQDAPPNPGPPDLIKSP